MYPVSLQMNPFLSTVQANFQGRAAVFQFVVPSTLPEIKAELRNARQDLRVVDRHLKQRSFSPENGEDEAYYLGQQSALEAHIQALIAKEIEMGGP